MQAYVVSDETTTDEAMIAEYRSQVPATLVPFGGEFVVRGGTMTVVEGEWLHSRVVIIAFPSRAAAEGWYNSPAYQKILPLRHNSAIGNFVIVDGPA
jgi:uncharacterized protein (DUF1330 family)